MNDHTPKPAAKPAKLSLLRQSYELYHAADYGKAETPRPNTKEAPYNTHEKPYYGTELQRLYLRDVFQTNNKNEQAFPYDIILDLQGVYHGLLIVIGDVTLRSEKTTYGDCKVTIPVALVPEAIKNGYISKGVDSNYNTIICNVSLTSDEHTIKNVASFTIFQGTGSGHYISRDKNGKKHFPGISNLFKDMLPKKTVKYNTYGITKRDENNNPIYEDYSYFVQHNVIPLDYTSNSFVPMTYELSDFYYHQRSVAYNYFYDQEEKEGEIYFKFFDLNQVAPHPDADKRFLPPDYYISSFVKTGDRAGKPYFRLVNPKTIPQAYFEKHLKDGGKGGKPVKDYFFKFSAGDFYNDQRSLLENPEKFYIMPPLDYGDIMGVKVALPMPGGERVEVISALANTNGFNVKVEPNVFLLPSNWQDSTGNLKPNIQYDKTTGIYKKTNPRRNLIEEYDSKQNLMVTKQVNLGFAHILQTKQGGAIEITGNGSVTLTSNHYCTDVQFRSTKKTKLENVTVDVWDCIKHVGSDRLSFMRADEFYIIQYTTAEEVTNKPFEVTKGFKQNTLWVQGEDGKMKRLEAGLVHKISKKQMWGVENLDTLANKPKDYKIPNRLQFHIGQGADVFVVGYVKNGVPDWHKINVTGQYRTGLDFVNY